MSDFISPRRLGMPEDFATPHPGGGPVIRDPKPAVAPLRCRRGDGLPTQGEVPPQCDGIVQQRTLSGVNEVCVCSKCGLMHGFMLGGEDGVQLLYGTLL